MAAMAAIVGLAPLPAVANIDWEFNPSGCVSTIPANNCNSEFADSRTFETSLGTGPYVTVTGWANTLNNNDTKLEMGDIAQYSGGLGVRNADWDQDPNLRDFDEGDPPEHAMDNNDRFDLILFDFGDEEITLNSVTLGWTYLDADISMLAYTGDGDPTGVLPDRTYTGTSQDLTSNGWTTIGSYDVDFTDPSDPPIVQPIAAADSVSSSYWIVSAYNPAVGECKAGMCQSDNYLDYVKIVALAGTVTTPPPPDPPAGVPAPGSALLLAAGLPFMRRLHRQAQL